MRLIFVICFLLVAMPVRAGTYPVAGLLPDLSFTLVDDHGRPVDERSFRGQAIALYFGYTGCGDACPLTLMRLTAAVQAMGADARHVRVLFVTVTPQIDRPRILAAYLGAYNCGRLVGLTGRESDVRALARRLRAAWPVMSGSPPIHGTSVYIFDGKGRAVSMVTDDGRAADITEALTAALHDPA